MKPTPERLARAAAMREHQVLVLRVCRCIYPLVIARNVSGHDPECPAHALITEARTN